MNFLDPFINYLSKYQIITFSNCKSNLFNPQIVNSIRSNYFQSLYRILTSEESKNPSCFNLLTLYLLCFFTFHFKSSSKPTTIDHIKFNFITKYYNHPTRGLYFFSNPKRYLTIKFNFQRFKHQPLNLQFPKHINPPRHVTSLFNFKIPELSQQGSQNVYSILLFECHKFV